MGTTLGQLLDNFEKKGLGTQLVKVRGVNWSERPILNGILPDHTYLALNMCKNLFGPLER